MSFILNNSEKFLRVQSISFKLIIPLFPLRVSITASNLSILFTNASSHPIDFSKLNTVSSSFQFLFFFVFDKAPLQPFLLSNS